MAITLTLKRPNDNDPLMFFTFKSFNPKTRFDSETKDALKFEVKSETSSPPNPN